MTYEDGRWIARTTLRLVVAAVEISVAAVFVYLAVMMVAGVQG